MTAVNINHLFSILREAGELALAELADRKKDIRKKGDADFVTATDLAVQDLIHSRLSSLYPDIGFFSEELPEECEGAPAAEGGREYWVLDPIDGTMNFIRGIPCFSISLALVCGGDTQLGIVHAPATGEMFYAERGAGAFLGPDRIYVTEESELEGALIAVGTAPYYKPETGECFDIYKKFFLSSLDVRRLGSAALDICYVAAGRFDGFYEYMLSIWDYAAARLILTEAGGKLTNLSNEETKDERKSPIVASNSKLHGALINIINN